MPNLPFPIRMNEGNLNLNSAVTTVSMFESAPQKKRPYHQTIYVGKIVQIGDVLFRDVVSELGCREQ
jgi:hypothetical protein